MIDNNHIKNTLTVTEAAALTGYNVRTIREKCEKETYTARKSGSTWLIDKNSVIADVKVN